MALVGTAVVLAGYGQAAPLLIFGGLCYGLGWLASRVWVQEKVRGRIL